LPSKPRPDTAIIGAAIPVRAQNGGKRETALRQAQRRLVNPSYPRNSTAKRISQQVSLIKSSRFLPHIEVMIIRILFLLAVSTFSLVQSGIVHLPF
jgi:hypothetical protein